MLCALLLNACATPQLRSVPEIHSPHGAMHAAVHPVAAQPALLKVMTLNMAHSRSDGFHQLFQDSATAQQNLDAILDVVRTQDPHVVALQESDGPSFWSGNFDHVAYLARRHVFTHYTRSEHVRGPMLSYGNALLSGLPLSDPLTVTFDPELSILAKGFLVSTIRWPGSPHIEVDVVSTHLDPFSPSVRKLQAMELIETLQQRNRPVILMGDFNTDWQQESALRMIADALQLQAYRPDHDHPGMNTFPALGKRLDWILVSPRFEFVSYRVLPDVVSDHLGVVAQLAIKQPATSL